MGSIDPKVLIFALALLAIGVQPGILKAVAEALRNFRGGPPSPRHPLPGFDLPAHFRSSKRSD